MKVKFEFDTEEHDMIGIGDCDHCPLMQEGFYQPYCRVSRLDEPCPLVEVDNE